MDILDILAWKLTHILLCLLIIFSFRTQQGMPCISQEWIRILHFCNKMYDDYIEIILRVSFIIYDVSSIDVVVQKDFH
jgi:hypothetical protein